MLAWTIYLSFAGALIEALLPKEQARAGAMVLRWRLLSPGWCSRCWVLQQWQDRAAS